MVFVVAVCFLSGLLQPKYMTDLVEGSMLSQYYREYGNHDVIFLGDCEMYANVSPMELYRERGITSYVRGSSQQLVWQSYYLLKETFDYELPKVVVYNVNAMRYSEPVSEAYNRLTIDKMKWSEEKVGIIRASMMEEETFLSYVVPLLRYHSRYDELTGEDLEYLFKTRNNTWNGYLVNTGVKPAGELPAKRPLAEAAFGDICYDYLEDMTRLCQKHEVELILVKAPSLYPYWYEEYDDQIARFADAHGLVYYDFTKVAAEIGIDYETDTYDGGLHLNHDGAVKFSGYIADVLAEKHNLQDRRNDPEIANVYNQKLSKYDSEITKLREKIK